MRSMSLLVASVFFFLSPLVSLGSSDRSRTVSLFICLGRPELGVAMGAITRFF